ncbi:hypothetical protein BBJ28_00001707 [Nothophytophthora sp. Chile5]|nr:hypothetical protein BBJ28_00001707 [Nothophytophthora sp. Chile5]
MQTYKPLLLVAAIAAVATNPAVAQSGSASLSSLSASGSSSSSLSPELQAIPECNSTQLDDVQQIMTTNEREAQCESALSLTSTMLQVTTAEANEICSTASCRAALKQLYAALPDCRYETWGFQYSAEVLLEYCDISLTSSSSTSGSGSVGGWTVSDSGSTTFVPAGETPTPTTASSSTSDGSAASTSPASTTAAVSAALAAAAGLAAVFLA